MTVVAHLYVSAYTLIQNEESTCQVLFNMDIGELSR